MMKKISKESRDKMRQGAVNSNKVRHKNYVEKYNKNPKKCKYCGKKIPYEKRGNTFCNHSCSASFSNRGVVRNGVKYKQRYCLNCGQKIIKSKYTQKYCSIKCQHEWEYYQYIFKWMIGEISGTIKDGSLSKTVRRFLFNIKENRCEICNNDKWQGKNIPLELDHIDGDSTNNSLNNLRVICPNCHAQTDTYKGKNKGSGRYKRMQRYQEGKSY